MLKPGETAMTLEQAATRAMLFFAIGLAASALLIAWVRFVSRRKSAST